MQILGIESSCDDTSIALVEASEKGFVVIAEKTASQIEVHKKYGGVVPEVAGRKHAENILPVIEEVMKNQEKPDVIAVTSGPGLITGLVVGVEVAKTLSYLWDIPLVGVNHIDGHIHSVQINNEQLAISKKNDSTESNELINQLSIKQIIFPALCLVASGGHTELILMRDHGDYEIIGKTLDDAAGECFDKAAKLLGLDYPGGPKISKFALEGNTRAIPFPRPMLKSDDFNFSFAGLKTSALYWLKDNQLAATKILPFDLPTGIGGMKTNPITISDFCASFEQAIIDVLVTKTLRAAEKYQPKTVILGGGVSANEKLRNTLDNEIAKLFLVPLKKYSMDNAAMIAVAGYYKAVKNEFTPWQELRANPNWKIDQKQ